MDGAGLTLDGDTRQDMARKNVYELDLGRLVDSDYGRAETTATSVHNWRQAKMSAADRVSMTAKILQARVFDDVNTDVLGQNGPAQFANYIDAVFPPRDDKFNDEFLKLWWSRSYWDTFKSLCRATWDVCTLRKSPYNALICVTEQDSMFYDKIKQYYGYEVGVYYWWCALYMSVCFPPALLGSVKPDPPSFPVLARACLGCFGCSSVGVNLP